MRIALISDIHANLVAFETVLRDMDRQQPDRIVFLGDACTLGPHPGKVMQLLRGLDCACVLGNHDSFVLDRTTVPDLEWTSRWFAEQLSDDDREFLAGFNPTISVELGPGESLTCYHGSPRSFEEQILPDTPADTLDVLLDAASGPVFAGGHTHVQMMRQHRGRLIINAGSIGMPFQDVSFSRETGPRLLPWAEYALLDVDGASRAVQLRQLPLDMARLRESFARSAMPGAMDWFGFWLPG